MMTNAVTPMMTLSTKRAPTIIPTSAPVDNVLFGLLVGDGEGVAVAAAVVSRRRPLGILFVPPTPNTELRSYPALKHSVYPVEIAFCTSISVQLEEAAHM